MVLAGNLDWNSWVLPRPVSSLLGLVFLFVGIVGFLVATYDLGMEETSGKEGDLRTDGFYRYTRNPQIVFLFVILIGGVCFSNSVGVVVVAMAMGVWLALMPFAEEPWLQERYGEEYSRYRESTPRFIDVRSVRRLRREIGRFNEDGF
jgi:protein-S-isoprenylcysteine O-methyltransferase Ste14